jgi:hypothetical protein
VIKALALKTLEVVKQLRATFAPPTGGPTTAADLIERVQVRQTIFTHPYIKTLVDSLCLHPYVRTLVVT